MTEAPHLRSAIQMLRAYVSNDTNTKPILVIGKIGWGRGHWIDVVLKESGYKPVWLIEPRPITDTDIEGTKQFPVYDLQKPEYPPADRAIVLVDSDAKIPESMKTCMVAVFETPAEFAIRQFLEEQGTPGDLCEGNMDYWSATQAIKAWKAAKIPIQAIPVARPTWSTFFAGGKAPFEGPLLAYYLGENLPPKNWVWNRSLSLEMYLPRSIHRLLMDEIRIALRAARPDGDMRFPWILSIKKRGEEQPKSGFRLLPVRAPQASQPTMDRSYALEW